MGVRPEGVRVDFTWVCQGLVDREVDDVIVGAKR